MKLVLVHDYLNQMGGAERVVAALHHMYPDAEIRTLFVDYDRLWPSLSDAMIQPTFLQHVPVILKRFKLFFWLYPFVIRNIMIRNCDVVISSSSAYAKGVRIGRNKDGSRPFHICYCHTPMRFAWDYDRYIANETSSKLLVKTARLLVPTLRRWDVRTARSVDLFVANSDVVKGRISRYYNREAIVIHPPVQMKAASGNRNSKDYFLVVSRLVSYKRIDLAVQACTRLNLPLVVIGRGPDFYRLQKMAGKNVRFLGYQPDDVLTEYMAGCKALLFPGEEDFGITPLEVNSLGRPVVAFRAGGATETIVDGVSGVFFSEPEVESICEAIQRVEAVAWDPQQIKAAARRFETVVFEEKLTELVQEAARSGMSSSATSLFPKQGTVSG